MIFFLFAGFCVSLTNSFHRMSTRKRTDKVIDKICKSSFFSWCCRKDVQLKLKLGFDINGQVEGCEPKMPLLYIASFGRSYKTCKFLLENGAQVNIEFDTRLEKVGHVLPIHCAVQQDCPKILQLLIDYGANLDGSNENCSEQHMNPLANALHNNFPRIVKILIDNGVNYSKTFFWSVANNKRKYFKILFENGANINLPQNNDAQ